MVLIHEFRVPLHMTVDEFQVAQLYMVVNASEKLTGDGEGVEILVNEPYDNTDGHDSMVLIEEAWNSYPHCVTVIVNGYLAKHKFYISIESMHKADRGDSENALGMSNNELSQRKVEVYVTICIFAKVLQNVATIFFLLIDAVAKFIQIGHCRENGKADA
ncbi:unnamed protein product [Phytophthora lilii]|uniref:Unnamed protein product n=1 Tax=Phytophthora lilii TaxID=2077276 RepID=A0A9W6TY46_9STRA|nr:unnamed protein product [Phytophthora lilii]